MNSIGAETLQSDRLLKHILQDDLEEDLRPQTSVLLNQAV